MLEIIRRILVLGLVLGAVWTYVYALPGILRVRPVMLREESVNSARVALDDSEQTLLKHNLGVSPPITVHGPEWTAFADNAFATVDRRPPSRQWRMRYGKHDLANPIYFSPDENPLRQVKGRFGGEASVLYLALGDGRYFGLSRVMMSETINEVPGWLAHPYRELSVLLLLAAFLVYILLPWPKREPGALTYARGSSVIGPDWLGIGLAAVFFAIVLLAISDNTNAAPEAGWWFKITGWALPATLPGISILIVGLWYASFALTIRPDSLRVVSLRRTDEMRFADITATRMEPFTSPTWLKVLCTILVIFTFGRGAYLIPLVFQQQPGLTLLGADGRKIRLLIGNLPGCAALLSALARFGVPLPAEMRDMLADAEANMPEAVLPKSNAAGKVALGVLICGLCLGIWLFTSRYSPVYRVPSIPAKPLTDAEVERIRQRHAVLMEAQNQVTAAHRRYEQAPANERDAAYQDYQAALDRYIKLNETLEGEN